MGLKPGDVVYSLWWDIINTDTHYYLRRVSIKKIEKDGRYGCKQDCENVRTTASSMTAEEYEKVKEENNGRVGFCDTKS